MGQLGGNVVVDPVPDGWCWCLPTQCLPGLRRSRPFADPASRAATAPPALCSDHASRSAPVDGAADRSSVDAAPAPTGSVPYAGSGADVSGAADSKFVDAAFDKKGCWRCQQRLSDALSEKEKMQLAGQFKDRVFKAVQHPYANFVVKMLMETMNPQSISFMVDEMKGKARHIAIHKTGCRSMQRLLELFPSEMIRELFDEILGDAAVRELCRHQFGTYVMSHVCEYGTPEQQNAVVQVLAKLVKEDFARFNRPLSNVVKKALKTPGNHADDPLARALLRDEHSFRQLAMSHHGNFAARVLVSLPPGWARDQARQFCRSSEDVFLRLQRSDPSNPSGMMVMAELLKAEQEEEGEGGVGGQTPHAAPPERQAAPAECTGAGSALEGGRGKVKGGRGRGKRKDAYQQAAAYPLVHTAEQMAFHQQQVECWRFQQMAFHQQQVEYLNAQFADANYNYQQHPYWAASAQPDFSQMPRGRMDP